MSDVTQAVTQDEIADSLLGSTDDSSNAAAVQDSTGVEGAQEQLAQQPTEQQPTEQVEEEADDWLPSDQEKVFPDDVLLRYAARYGLDEQRLTDPLLKQLVVDKINSDIFLRQQQQQEEQQFDQFEEPQPQPEPTQPQRTPTLQEHLASLERALVQRTDPEIAKSFHADFLRAFGVPEAEIAKTSPQQAMAFTMTAQKYMLNMVNTFLPDMLQAQMQSVMGNLYPQFDQMYDVAVHRNAWEQVRASNPAFANLPEYGKQNGAFGKAIREAAARIPGFERMQFPGNPMEAAVAKYTLLAQIASGQQMDPQALQKAAAAGARNARRAQVTRQAGNLSSGQSKSATGAQGTGNSKFQTNADIFDEEAMSIWQREHGRL